MSKSLQAVLRNRPNGHLAQNDVEIVEAVVPDLATGEFIVENKYITIDFAMRGWMAEGRSYVPQLDLGEIVRGCATGYVSASKNPNFKEGDAVSGMLGVRTHAVSDGDGIFKVDTSKASLRRWAGGLGLTTAITGYLGLLCVGLPNPGETVLVSGASGGVGSIVGQIARIQGCKAIGIAGGAEKCERVLSDLGFHACIDYKAGDLLHSLMAACPQRIDVLFENVGGEVLDTSLSWMNSFGRVVLCGLTSDRNVTGEAKGIMNLRCALVERLTLHGFILFDHSAGYAQAAHDIGNWYSDGLLCTMQDEQVWQGGISNFCDALNDVLAGQNHGKVILEV